MPLSLHEVSTREELDAIVPVQWASFYNLFRREYQIYHPVFGVTKSDRDKAVKDDQERLWQRHVAEPGSHWIYVQDDDTQEIVGATEWLVFMKNPFPNGDQRLDATQWPAGTEAREFATEVQTQAYAPRQMWMQKPHLAPNAMGVLPAHRRRGIGTLLMQWGIDKANELGFESLIEASDDGRFLYEKFGYRILVCVALNMDKKNPSDEWRAMASQLGTPVQWIMWRPPRGEWGPHGPKAPWGKLLLYLENSFRSI